MKESVRFILREILAEIPVLSVGLLLTLFVSILTWVGPRVISGIIDEGFVPGDRTRVFRGVLLLALCELLRLLSIAGSQSVYGMLGQNVIERVRRKMVSHLASLPVPYFDKVTSGGMMTRVVNDANSLTDFFQSGFVSVLGNLGSLAAVFAGLFVLSPTLGLSVFLVFLPFAWICFKFSERLRTVYEEMRSRLSDLNSTLADYLFGMRTLRALGMNTTGHGRLREKVLAYAESQRGMIRTYALFHPTITLATGLFLLILIGVGLPDLASGRLKVGAWVAALSYILMMQQPLTEISDRWNFFLAGITSIGRVREVLEIPAERSGGMPATAFESVRFEEVSFRYPAAEHPALEPFSLEIRRGEWIGIFGESGSGKSTFLQLLYGFMDPEAGRVLYNGRDLRGTELASLRSRFGVVEQFPFLFAGTIEENLTWFGMRGADFSGLRARFSGSPLILSLLDRPDFRIAERGANLSLGEKQMITFLRAWLQQPEIWILDEATAFFDPSAERELLQVLEDERSRGITVIQVAHRAEALRRMDRLIRINSGVLLEWKGSPPSEDPPSST
jgi:ATP-binding cassette subfamily B multidrug efflux pump